MPAVESQRSDQCRVGNGGRRNRKERVLLDRHERVYRCRVENRVVLVSSKEKSSLASVVERQPQLDR